jgi:arylsulfatase A-like enzyme
MRKLTLFILINALSCLATERPNVIIVITDDQGYADLSCHGHPILETPSFDLLYRQSLRLGNFHVAPVCTPTRSELMTGLYALRNKASTVPSARNWMRRDIVTMPEIFLANGYATGIFGKWGLGDAYPNRPMDRGFTHSIWHKGWGLASEIEYDNDYYYTRYLEGTEVKYSDRFCANLWFHEAMEWMDQKMEAKQPFFTYIALNTPHSPFHPLREDLQKYKDKVDDENIAKFYGLIANADENFGRLEGWLKKRDAKENTIVIFMNDNGTALGADIYNAGMRGKKGSGYEGGHRAFCFLRWPNGDLGLPRTIGSVSHVVDLVPTLVDLLNFKLPDTAEPFDGFSLVPAFKDSAALEDRKAIVQFGGRIKPEKYFRSSVMWKDWRLQSNSELYNLDVDPSQTLNIFAKYPDIVRELKGHYETFWASIEDSIDVIEHIIVGNPAEPTTHLTCANWFEVDFDNRGKVAGADSMGGPWYIEAERGGNYRVQISRWPFYLNRPLSVIGPGETIGGMPIDPGVALPIASGTLSLNGEDRLVAKPNYNGTLVEFNIAIPAGKHMLQAWFHDASGEQLSGAFYATLALD